MSRTIQAVIHEAGFIVDILTIVHLGGRSRVCVGPQYNYDESIEFDSPRHNVPNFRRELIEKAFVAVNQKVIRERHEMGG